MRIKAGHYIFLLLATILIQSCGIKARIKKADKRYEIGEYFAVGDLYKNIYSGVPTKDKTLRAKIAFRQAECYRLTNQARAEQAYLNAIRNNYPDSIVFLHYALVLQRNGKYAEASKNFQIYLKKDSTSVVAINGIKVTKLLAEWTKTPSRYVVKRPKVFYMQRTS